MSINSLTDDQLRRIDRAEAAARKGVYPELAAAAPAPAPPANDVSNALNMLLKYIPTESVTLYVATASSLDDLRQHATFLTPWTIYLFYSLLTPALLLLIFAGKVRSSGRPLPGWRDWPWWKLVASTIAFMTWALAVPTNPFNLGAVAGLLAVLISMLLSLIEPLVTPPLPRPATPA